MNDERFSGGIVGEGVATHLRVEREDGSGTLICYERVRCELGGLRGAFLLEASAVMTPGLVNGRWTIVEEISPNIPQWPETPPVGELLKALAAP